MKDLKEYAPNAICCVFSKQACKPTGLFGRWVMPSILDIANAGLNRLLHAKLSPIAGDHIL
jgi:hypothetical protein